MRILFDSKQPQFKTPFGTLLPEENCTLHIHIPATVRSQKVECLISLFDGSKPFSVPLTLQTQEGPYEIFRGSFSLPEPGLYHYYFRIHTPDNSFRLFKYGNDTNMEDGDLWQVSCIPTDFTVPKWAQGAVIYQIFPDRFCKSGDCDLRGKLTPYTLHENWDEEVQWQPTPDGQVLNNDFFGGNFRGITEKLDYIVSLGTTILYLNPISKSFSSHRYDTADYKTPDPMLGTMEEFSQLCREAHKRGIRVILDGVYSHTGSDSLYFDKSRTFGGNGAYCTKESPYYTWYQFDAWPDKYHSWWGFDTLPTVNKLDPSFIDYIITGENSVIAHWLKAGCDGFRLDVADELPDEFLSLLKKHLRKLRPDALLMGEVWEDASDKISYGIRRRYFVDGQLDSVMNYPFRNAILAYLRGQDDGRGLADTVMTIAENYPPQVLLCNMNLLGTHDSPRILTALVDDFDGSREEQAHRHLSPQQHSTAVERLLIASLIQYTLPGAPSLYYADEAGMEGYKDPFNRRTYPWGRENKTLLEHFKLLGKLKNQLEALRLGDIHFFHAGDGRLGFTRQYAGQTLRICVNRSDASWEIPVGKLLLGRNLQSVSTDAVTLSSGGMCILEET
ncbi:MAG: glycoside hydrolase family 13 protein [Oscillospiraceae bacterium]|nr:glycoside hydrolase family 13 protein [Oscillospiraceae bacterium]